MKNPKSMSFAVMIFASLTTVSAFAQIVKPAPKRMTIDSTRTAPKMKTLTFSNEELPASKKRIQIRPVRLSLREGGSNIGGSEDNIRAVNEWCDDVVGDLKRQEMVAVGKWADGSMSLAIDLYKEGFSKILERAETLTSSRDSWTYKMAERALLIADRLTADQADYGFQRNLIQHYYELIENNYMALDSRYYRNDLRAIENRLQVHAAQEIAWFEANMLIKAQTAEISPKYSDRVFYMTLATLAKSLGEDLSSTGNDPVLFPTRFAKVSKNLKRLATQMENALAGNGAQSSEPRTVGEAYRELKRIQADLN